nr:MAG TPA: minor tail protein [Caudoviricetes sp.]
MNKDGVVSIGIEYKKEFNQMISDYESALSEMASNKTLSKGMKVQFENVIAELRSFKAEMDKQLSDLSMGKVDITKFESFKKSVSKKFDSINGDIGTLNTAVSLLNEKMDMVGNGIDLSKIQNNFKGLTDYINRTNDAVDEFVKRMDGQGIHLFSYDKTNQKEIRTAIKMIDSELKNLDKDYGAKFELFNEKEAQNELDKLATELRSTIELLDSAKSTLSNMDSSSDAFKKTIGEITALELKAARLSDTMEILYDTASEKELSIGITDDKNLASYDKYVDELSVGLDTVSKSAERAKKELSSLLGDIKNTSSVQFSDKLNPNSAQLTAGVTIEADSNELWKKISPVLTDLQNKLNSNPVIAPVKLVVAPTAVSQNNNPDQSISAAYSQKYAKKLAQTGEDAIIDMEGVYKKTYTSIMDEAVKCAEESIVKIQDIFEKAPINIKLQLPQEQLDKINNFVLFNKDEKKIDISGQVDKVKTNVSELNNELKETTELVQKATQNGSIKFDGIEDFTKQITNSLSSLEKLQDILKTLQNVEIALANVSGLNSITEIDNQWEALIKRINNAIKVDGTFRKNVNVGKLASEYQKYLDMGGKNELSSIGKLKDNETVINAIISKMKELSSQKVDTTSVNQAVDSFDKFRSSLDDIILRLDHLLNLTRDIGNTFLKMFKDSSVSGVDKQWSSIESKFKSIADDFGKINLSKQKKDIRELIEMYQKYVNAGGMNTLFNLTDNAETIKKMNKVYEQMNSKQDGISVTNETKNFTQIEDSVNSLTSAINTKTETIQIEANTMELAARAEVKSIQKIIDALNPLIEKIENIPELKIPREDTTLQSQETNISNGSNPAIEQQNKLQEELKETQQQAENTAKANHELAESEREVALAELGVTQNQKKDAFQVDNSSVTNASTSAIKEENNALEQLTESTNQLNVIQAKSDSTYWQNRFKESVKDMTSTNDELVKMKKYYQDMSREAEKAYNAFEKQKTSYINKLTGYTDTTKYTSDFINRASTLQKEVTHLDLTNPQDVTRLQEIDAEVIKIINDSKLLENKLVKQRSKLSEIVSQMKIFKSQNTRMSGSQKSELDRIIKYAETMQQSGKEVSSEVENIKVRFAGLKAVVNETGQAGKNFLDTIKDKAWYSWATQFASMFSLYDVINGIRRMSDAVIELNTNITELAKVSDVSVSSVYQDFQSYADISKEIGGTISDTISATTDWSRNGYSLPDSKQLAEVAQLYKNVGDGIDIDEANASLISTLRGFQLEADQAEHIIDVFNEVSNNEPIDSGGIGDALQRSAASFNAANTSLEKSVSLITGTNSVLQDPEKVGNMWKTVSARLRGADAELKEMGEDTDGMVTSTSKLRDLIKGMTGFDIMKDDNTFKDVYDIVVGIGEKWDSLSDVNQASLLEKLAGKNQSNALAAALANVDTIKKAYGEATNAEGSARKEQERVTQSIQYSINQAKASLEELSNDVLNSNFLKGAIDNVGKFVDLLDHLVDSAGVVPTLLTGIAGFASIKDNFGKLFCF